MPATASTAGAGDWGANGKWAIAGIGTASGADGVLVSGVLTPTVSPAWTVGALIGRKMKLDGTLYAISDNDATTATITAPPGDATYAYVLEGAPLPTDIVQVKHAMTVDGAVRARLPESGTFASLDLASAGGASPGLVVTGTVEIVCTATVLGIENLHDSGVAAVLTVTGSGETTLNESYLCEGTTIFTGTVTGGGPADTVGGVIVSGALTATKITGTSNSSYGVLISGSITGDVIGTSNSSEGVETTGAGTITGDVIGISTDGVGVDSDGVSITGDVTGRSVSAPGVVNTATIVADNITAQSTSERAFIDIGGTLTEGSGAAGVNLSVRRLDGGQAMQLEATTISDELKVTYISNSTTPLVV